MPGIYDVKDIIAKCLKGLPTLSQTHPNQPGSQRAHGLEGEESPGSECKCSNVSLPPVLHCKLQNPIAPTQFAFFPPIHPMLELGSCRLPANGAIYMHKTTLHHCPFWNLRSNHQVPSLAASVFRCAMGQGLKQLNTNKSRQASEEEAHDGTHWKWPTSINQQPMHEKVTWSQPGLHQTLLSLWICPSCLIDLN